MQVGETGFEPTAVAVCHPRPSSSPKSAACTLPGTHSEHKQAGLSPSTWRHRPWTMPLDHQRTCPGSVPGKCSMNKMHLECLKTGARLGVPFVAAHPYLSSSLTFPLSSVMVSLKTILPIKCQIHHVHLSGLWIPHRETGCHPPLQVSCLKSLTWWHSGNIPLIGQIHPATLALNSLLGRGGRF